jgi:hypothetical protein
MEILPDNIKLQKTTPFFYDLGQLTGVRSVKNEVLLMEDI